MGRGKTLLSYHPDRQRSRIKSQDYIPPMRNTSSIVFGDRSSRDTKHYTTTNSNSYRGLSFLGIPASHPGIIAYKNRWIRKQIAKWWMLINIQWRIYLPAIVKSSCCAVHGMRMPLILTAFCLSLPIVPFISVAHISRVLLRLVICCCLQIITQVNYSFINSFHAPPPADCPRAGCSPWRTPLFTSVCYGWEPRYRFSFAGVYGDFSSETFRYFRGSFTHSERSCIVFLSAVAQGACNSPSSRSLVWFQGYNR